MLDEMRQTKAKARRALGIKRPLLQKVTDFLIHTVNKCVNGKNFTEYKDVNFW